MCAQSIELYTRIHRYHRRHRSCYFRTGEHEWQQKKKEFMKRMKIKTIYSVEVPSFPYSNAKSWKIVKNIEQK